MSWDYIQYSTRRRGWKHLSKPLINGNKKTEDLLNMAEFVLKNNFFEFHGNIKQQVSGTAIGVKYALTYACIFMDELERTFYKHKIIKNFYGSDI